MDGTGWVLLTGSDRYYYSSSIQYTSASQSQQMLFWILDSKTRMVSLVLHSSLSSRLLLLILELYSDGSLLCLCGNDRVTGETPSDYHIIDYDKYNAYSPHPYVSMIK